MEQAIINTPNNVPKTIALTDFIAEFKDSLLASLNASNPPVYQADKASVNRQHMMDSMIRKPFTAQLTAWIVV